MINRLEGLTFLKSKGQGATTASHDPAVSFDLQEIIQPVEQLIVKHSGWAIVVAFAVGVTIACLVKRR